MRNKITGLIEHYIEAEQELYDEITRMKSFGRNCECDGCIAITMIDDSFGEIRKYCLDCGGYAK